MLTDEVRFKLLKLLETNPKMSQREVARELGISLGKVNYCLKALVEKGWLKATNFKNSKNKNDGFNKNKNKPGCGSSRF